MTASRVSRYQAGRVVDVVDRAFRGDQAAMDTFLNRGRIPCWKTPPGRTT